MRQADALTTRKCPCGKVEKEEEAVGLYQQAGTQYKKSKNWDKLPDPYNQNSLALGLASLRASQPSVLQDRRCRRVYCGGFAPDMTEQQLRDFFDQTLKKIPGRVVTPGVNEFATKSVNINRDKNYAFIEFFDKDDSTIVISMDGIVFNGQALALRRPKEYHEAITSGQLMEEVPKLLAIPGMAAQQVPDGPDKLFMGNIPLSLTDTDVRTFASSYGSIAAFHLAKEPGTNISKGYAFFKYEDPSVAEDAAEGLNGITIGLNLIICQLVSKGKSSGGPGGLLTYEQTAPTPASLGLSAPLPPTKVLVLQNMVTRQELQDDQEYSDIVEDITVEMGKYGAVVSVFIPRPGKDAAIIGKVFCEFAELQGAQSAEKGMKGKKFSGRMILTTYMNEQDFRDRKFPL